MEIMQIKFLAQRNEKRINYDFDGQQIMVDVRLPDGSVYEDTFDFSTTPEAGFELDISKIETTLPVQPILSAEYNGTEWEIELIKYHGNLQDGAEYPDEIWRSI